MKNDFTTKLLLYSSCLYIFIGLTLGLLVAGKLLLPTLGDFELLAYGRMRILHTNAVLFGWLFQANLGILLFILPRMLHTELYSKKIAALMAVLFNITVLGAVIHIVVGKVKNVEYGEIAPPFDYLIVICWVLFAINVIGTIAKRKVKYMYVSVWYILGTVIWTTFVYITGNILTQLPFVKGITQANLAWFYVHNAVGLVFTPMGVAIAYYLIPISLKTPLYSHKLSLVGFWVISFVYVWTGAHHMLHGPISYWLQTVAILFSWSLIIPVVAVVTNFFGTFAQAPKKTRMDGPIPKFLLMGTVYYLFTCLQGPFQSIRAVNAVVSKTDWVVGHAHMAVLGAFSYFAIAGIYYILPKIVGKSFFSSRLGEIHFWLLTLGTLPFFAILWIGGVLQGFAWLDPSITFLEIVKMMKVYHIVRLISGSLIFVSIGLFLYNILETISGKGKELQTNEI